MPWLFFMAAANGVRFTLSGGIVKFLFAYQNSSGVNVSIGGAGGEGGNGGTDVGGRGSHTPSFTGITTADLKPEIASYHKLMF